MWLLDSLNSQGVYWHLNISLIVVIISETCRDQVKLLVVWAIYLEALYQQTASPNVEQQSKICVHFCKYVATYSNITSKPDECQLKAVIAWFKLLFREVCVCVCVCVCVHVHTNTLCFSDMHRCMHVHVCLPLRLLITNGVTCSVIDPVWLIQQVLQLL